MVTVDPPRVGPCSNWATMDDVVTVGNVDLNTVDVDLIELNLTVASEILWNKSGQQYAGTCEETVRPIHCEELARMGAAWFGQYGYPYVPDLVAGVWYNFDPGYACLACNDHLHGARIDLGQYPVTSISEVKIDGVVFDAANYRLDDWRYLTRTDGGRLPTTQDLRLADTEPGTWSVAIGFGQPPPQFGINACAQLAAELTKHCSGDTEGCQLPLRVTAITRAGVSYSVANVMDILNQGSTGLYFIDLFVNTVNPNKLDRPARVLSPDLQPPRRVGSLGG